MSQSTEAGLSQNPYASPVSDEAKVSVPSALNLASNGQRFATFFLDYIGMTLCSGLIGVVLGLVGGAELAALSGLLGIFVWLGYYAGFEAAFGKTPGKMLMGTRVVTTTGNPPSFGQCLGRTFARCVPFEPFSFFGSEPVGWHDRWTNTRVIRDR
ncbi:MAG TPA: RDD family protein [Polyangiaceae bacterium]|nr:RDD family protein [Polyangiaceae bacterium]